jgi:hypothetical protein
MLMTSEEFHTLVEECSCEGFDMENNGSLTLRDLAQLEREKGITLPTFYKEFLSMYGAGTFGAVTVLSPDPRSAFPIWETITQLENRECNFLGVVELDSDYYGFLIEHGVCSNDIWSADHEFGMRSATQVTQIFLIFSPRWHSMSGTIGKSSGRKTTGRASVIGGGGRDLESVRTEDRQASDGTINCLSRSFTRRLVRRI